MTLIQMMVSHHSGISHCRRQQRIVAPALFEAATSGNFAHAAEVLEEGDDLDVKVICLIGTQLYLFIWYRLIAA